VGINTAIYSPSGGSSGVGFAIPIDTVAGIVDQIIATGRVTRPALGVVIAPDAAAAQLGLRGVLVLRAPRGSPAGDAGVRGTTRGEDGTLLLGDVITAVDGAPVSDGSDLYRALDGAAAGQRVRLALRRGEGSEGGARDVEVTVTLGERVTQFTD
jgi:S1-C subfamily serine protease